MTPVGWAALELTLRLFKTANNTPWDKPQARMYQESLDFLPDDIVPALKKQLPLRYDWLPTPKQIHETATELLFGRIPDCAEGLRCFNEALKAYIKNQNNPGFDVNRIYKVLEDGDVERVWRKEYRALVDGIPVGEMTVVQQTRPAITANPVNLTIIEAMGGFDRVRTWTDDYRFRVYRDMYAEAAKQTAARQAVAVMENDYHFEGGRARLGAARYAGLLVATVPDDPALASESILE